MLLKNIGVAGSGMMGSEIALCFAMAGFEVTMYDVSVEAVSRGKSHQGQVLDKNAQKGRFNAEDKLAVLERIKTTDQLDDLRESDLIIEAVLENFEVKKKIFAELDSVCKEDCVFASNTSSIPITKLATAVSKKRAEKFLGMHFFSPATVMKLVEVIPSHLCCQDAVDFSKEAVKAIHHVPIQVKDVAGFVVNRILNIFSLEAIKLLEEGVATAEDIDTACKLGLGHPMGPLELMDVTSLDLNLKVHEVLFAEYGERFRPSSLMRKMVPAGLSGRKSGQGFYTYKKSI